MFDVGIWGNVADWVVALIAFVGLRFAMQQLKAVRKAEEQSAASNAIAARAHETGVEIARANMLRQIDSEFESEDMYRSRKAILALEKRSENAVRKDHAEASEQKIEALLATECSRQLTKLWNEASKFDDEDVEAPGSKNRIASDRYAEIMRLPCWFETLGHMIRRDLLPKTDILEVYDAAINPTMEYLADHIRKRRSEGPIQNPHFLEHAMWLSGVAKEFTNVKNAPPTTNPVASKGPFS